MGRDEKDWPVFWCSLLAPVLLGEMSKRQRARYFLELSQREHVLPDGHKKRISVRTFRRQWQRLRDEGVQGLFRRPRSDRGQPRKDRDALLARAVELKIEQPYRGAEAINRMLQQEFGRTVPRATLYRYLKQQGATRLKLGVSKQKVRCRWTRDVPGALWVGDFEHGPYVIHNHRSVRTHLSAWIDCHSRYIVEGRYYVRENLDVLSDSLLRAWGIHGASKELYVDNAKVYHSHALLLACTQLNIKLLHRPPRDPAAGGLIERFFQTVQMQFEAEVRASNLLTLDQLNESFHAWLDVVYHERPHGETKQTPHERYHQDTRVVRHVNLADVLAFFYRKYERTSDRDHSDVQINNRFYAVAPKLRGDRLIVHHNPFANGNEVQLYSPGGIYLGLGRLYQREKGSHPTLPSPAPQAPIEPRYLKSLRDEHAAKRQRQRVQGVDYHSARKRNVWSLAAFTAQFAKHLGRKGGVSGLNAREVEALARFHTLHDRVTERLLQQAVEQAEEKTIPAVLFQLQQLLQERSV